MLTGAINKDCLIAVSRGRGEGNEQTLETRPDGNTNALTGVQKDNLVVSPTIRAEHHNTADVHFIPQTSGIRRLTPKECERLQGFSDDWCMKGVDDKGNEVDISDSQIYKMCGNAVSVPIVELVARRLLKAMEKK